MDMNLDMQHVPYCPCLCCMDMDMQHVSVHAVCPRLAYTACPCPYCVSMSIQRVRVHVHTACSCLCPYCVSMSVLRVHVHAACPCPYYKSCPCCMFMSMLTDYICPCYMTTYVHAAFLCCMSTSMLYVYVHGEWPINLIRKSADFLYGITLINGLAEVGTWTSANENPLTIYIPLIREVFLSR
jgi:hypothetical protein